MNRIPVLLFARYAELLGAERIDVELADGARVTELLDALRLLPGGDRLPPSPFVAVNHARVAPDHPVRPGDEVALLPPLAGG